MSTLYHPRGDQPQSVSDLLFFEYPFQHVSLFEVVNTLTIVISNAVQLVLALSNLPLEVLHRVHGPLEVCHLSNE